MPNIRHEQRKEEKEMKKIFSIMLSAAMLLCAAACSQSGNGANAGSASDWDYIADKGTLVAGITYYEPMNYLDDNGELTGFETEFTKAVCEKLGVQAEFQVIDWNQKIVELQSKTIDVIWNGMTVKEEFKEQINFSTPYIRNK